MMLASGRGDATASVPDLIAALKDAPRRTVCSILLNALATGDVDSVATSSVDADVSAAGVAPILYATDGAAHAFAALRNRTDVPDEAILLALIIVRPGVLGVDSRVEAALKQTLLSYLGLPTDSRDTPFERVALPAGFELEAISSVISEFGVDDRVWLLAAEQDRSLLVAPDDASALSRQVAQAANPIT